MIVERADRSDAKDVGHLYGIPPRPRVDLAVEATPLRIVTRAVLALHTGVTMYSVLALAALIQAPAASLSYGGGSFTIRYGAKTESVDVIAPRMGMAPPQRVDKTGSLELIWDYQGARLERGDYAISWTSKGLWVREGKWSHVTRLPEIATSPKLQSADSIREVLARAGKGELELGASSLAGAEAIGDKLVLLIRWEDKLRKPWLEALISLDVAGRQRKPALIGKFTGFTRAAAQGDDDRLFMMGQALAAVTEDGAKWGLARFDPETGASTFDSFGERLDSWAAKGDSLYFVERTEYGTNLAGAVERSGAGRRLFAEARRSARWLALDPPLLHLEDSEGVRLMHAISGRLQEFAAGTDARWTNAGVLAWSPAKAPVRAALFNPEGWRPLARWEAAK